MSSQVPVTWSVREPPLQPAGLIASGAAARALALRLRDHPLEGLSALASREVWVLLGAAERLPWVDGVTYLGRAPGAAGLYLPTTARPDMAEALILRALRQQRGCTGPVALLPGQGLLIPLDRARAINTAQLAAWFETGGER